MRNMVVERYSIKDFETLKLVFNFAKSLQFSNEGTWEDKYGTTVISIERNIVSKLLQEWDGDSRSYAVILSPIIKGQVAVSPNHRFTNNFLKDVDYILSIGGAREHNATKEFLLKANKGKQSQLVSVPVPLSNDSFGTNRSSPYFGKVEVPSRESLYPSKIIIDFNLLDNIEDKLNITGIGEVIGLYYSLCDYYSIRKLSFPESLISDIERNAYNLIISLKGEKTIWLKRLAINLIKKCLIMRVANDNQIGAGGDHLIAYALEYQCRNDKNRNCRKLSHGKLVYLGSVAMASLFPEWEYRFFFLENLIDVGMKVGILELEDLNLLVNMLRNGLIPLSLQMRPSRLTSLSVLSSDRIRNGWVRINKTLKELEDFRK